MKASMVILIGGLVGLKNCVSKKGHWYSIRYHFQSLNPALTFTYTDRFHFSGTTSLDLTHYTTRKIFYHVSAHGFRPKPSALQRYQCSLMEINWQPELFCYFSTVSVKALLQDYIPLQDYIGSQQYIFFNSTQNGYSRDYRPVFFQIPSEK